MPTQSQPEPSTFPLAKFRIKSRIHCRPVCGRCSQKPNHGPDGKRSSLSAGERGELGSGRCIAGNYTPAQGRIGYHVNVEVAGGSVDEGNGSRRVEDFRVALDALNCGAAI